MFYENYLFLTIFNIACVFSKLYWWSPSLSELTSIIFDMELTRLGLEASNS